MLVSRSDIKGLQILLPKAANGPDGQSWTERKDRNGVVVANGLTKLPNIRGLSSASRRPAGADLAGIASDPFRHVSLPPSLM